jgi:hypothetical protein
MGGFKKATKQQSRLRLALYGPSGSGKTFTALTIGAALGKPVALIDTERGSASKYAGDVADFDVLELETFEPAKYIAAIREAASAGYPTLVIDSLSHAWMGKGGLLDQADAKGGRFDAWKTLTPQQHALVDAILAYPGDIIVTMRTKTEYVVEKDERGKSAPRKVGLAPVQKDSIEYEFDIAASLDIENTMHVEKSRCPALSGAVIRKPGADVAKTLRAWLEGGVPAPPKSEPRPVAGDALTVDLLRSLIGKPSFEDAIRRAVEAKVIARGDAKDMWHEHKKAVG